MAIANILIVEDDKNLSLIVSKFLTHHEYDCQIANNGFDAFKLLETETYQLIILDVMLPDSDGWTILRHVRDYYDTPVIMLTARSEEEDKLLGFELGADDYITKPFSNNELLARVKAVMKRTNKNLIKSVLEVSNISLNKLTREVLIDKIAVELTPIEYELLLYLMSNVDLVLSRTKILDSVWGYDYYGDERTVDTHIKRLRKKLLTCGRCIKTVRGVGYRMVNYEE